MRTGAEQMERSSESANADVSLLLGQWSIRFALRPAPRQFSAIAFALRITQHLIVYGAILIAAVYGCLFILAPLQTALLSVLLLLFVSIIVILYSSPRERLRRILEGGLVASYVAGMAAAVKASEFIANFLALLLHGK
jgi:hypothetical protein